MNPKTDVFAIDPGTEESGYCVFDGEKPTKYGIAPNSELRGILKDWLDAGGENVAIEEVRSYGMAVGATTFKTVEWIGRFVEIAHPREVAYIGRQEVKLHLCQSPRAADANVRQRIIDLYGGTRRKAIGLKAAPGPLYGMADHMWAAFGVALTWAKYGDI